MTESDEATALLSERKKRKSYKTYFARFVVSILLCMNTGLSGYILATFVSIWKFSKDFFDADAMAINMLAMIFMVLYIPGSLLSIFITERYGMSIALLLGAAMNALGCWVRYGGSDTVSDTDAKYFLVMLGQVIAALGQPLITNTPSRISNDWFPTEERNIAMFFMVQANAIGGGLGALIPSYQVRDRADIIDVLFWQAIAGTAIAVITAIFVQERPPTPPGRDVERQLALQPSHNTREALHIMYTSLAQFRTMLTNFNFNVLLTGFSLLLGVGLVLFGVVGQVINPCGYSAREAGLAAAFLTFSGVLSNIAVVAILSYVTITHHVTVQKGLFLWSLVTVVMCLASNRPNSIETVLLCWTLCGVALGPLVPVCLETGVEIVYPIPGEAVAALMLTGLSTVAVLLSLLVTPLLKLEVSTECDRIVTPAAIVLIGVAGMGVLFGLFVRADLRRSQAAYDTDEEEERGTMPPDRSEETVGEI